MRSPSSFRPVAPLRRLLALGLALGLILTVPSATRAADTGGEGQPFGLKCTAKLGLRFCQGGISFTRDLRVRSFDGARLDVDVAMPAVGSGPWPLVLMITPWGAPKSFYETDKLDGAPGQFFGPGYNIFNLASRGYIAVTYTPRGVIDSCGALEGSALLGTGLGPFNCDRPREYLHFADRRYEIRDAQFLAGTLVDEGLAKPVFGVTGGSYGGGQSLEHAQSNDRMTLPDGTLVALRSPSGVPMRVGAAFAIAPWSEMIDVAAPNGRTRTGVGDDLATLQTPTGIFRDSHMSLLYLMGVFFGRYAVADQDPQSAFPDWYGLFRKGPPYPPGEYDGIADTLHTWKSSGGVPDGGTPPAPTIIASGWTDDLFPPSQALRFWDRARRDYPQTPVWLRFADIGHGRASNRSEDLRRVVDDGFAFLDHYLRGTNLDGPPVRLLAQTCPTVESAPSAGPYDFASWNDVPTNTRTFNAAASPAGAGRLEAWGSADPMGRWQSDPAAVIRDMGLPWPGTDVVGATALVGTFFVPFPLYPQPKSCTETVMPDEIDGAARWTLDTAITPYTIVGMPTVTMQVANDAQTSPEPGAIFAKLWDVDPAGNRILITRGLWRRSPGPEETVKIQTFGTTWTVQPRHQLELTVALRDDRSFARMGGAGDRATVRNVAVAVGLLPTP